MFKQIREAWRDAEKPKGDREEFAGWLYLCITDRLMFDSRRSFSLEFDLIRFVHRRI